jgi:hypothetical protein
VKRTIALTLTPSEQRAIIEAVRIGLEDGSLEPWRKAALTAQHKICSLGSLKG